MFHVVENVGRFILTTISKYVSLGTVLIKEIQVTDFEKGFIAGLILGEGSFTGDKKQPAIQLKMHNRSIETLRKMLLWFPGSTLHGPYFHQKRNYSVWFLRGKVLRDSILFFDEISKDFDVHVRSRYEKMKERYAL
jgi:hypothetical protein